MWSWMSDGDESELDVFGGMGAGDVPAKGRRTLCLFGISSIIVHVHVHVYINKGRPACPLVASGGLYYILFSQRKAALTSTYFSTDHLAI